ncbi:MAG: hypothetical protein LBE64_09125 [Acinetobacter pittii]|jgi:lipopolysaccharide export LptBFGC system permease protein LptF|nr:hypothetical protein [Acinetobacter pittii]
MSDIVAGLLGVLVHYLNALLTFILIILLALFIILILASLCVLIGTLLGQGVVAAGKFFGAGRDV